MDASFPAGTIIHWLVGALVVLFYSLDRFDTPGPVRSTTTFARYCLARGGYVIGSLMLYAILGWLLVRPGFVELWKVVLHCPRGDCKDITTVTGLQAPLYAALLLTFGLPHVPWLRTIDDRIKKGFTRFGRIPIEIRTLSRQIRESEFSSETVAHQHLQPTFSTVLAEPAWLEAPHNTRRRHWARMIALYAIACEWRRLPSADRYVAAEEATWKCIERQVTELAPVAGGAVRRELAEQGPAADWLAVLDRDLGNKIDDLQTRLGDYIAGGILASTFSSGQRAGALKRLGFVETPRIAPAVTLNDAITVGSLVLLSMVLGAAVALPASSQASIRLFVMVPLIYAVAVVVAMYPKGRFTWASARHGGERPTAAYLMSGVVAAILGAAIGFFSRVVFGEFSIPVGTCAIPTGFLDRFSASFCISMVRWPWILMTLLVTLGIAFVADDYVGRPPETLPRWLRWGESLALGLFFLVLAFVTLKLLGSEFPGNRSRVYATALMAGAVIGYLVPHRHRTRIEGESEQTAAEAKLEGEVAPTADFDSVGPNPKLLPRG